MRYVEKRVSSDAPAGLVHRPMCFAMRSQHASYELGVLIGFSVQSSRWPSGRIKALEQRKAFKQ